MPEVLLESERADQLVAGEFEQFRELPCIPECDLFGVCPDGEDRRRLDFDFHVVGVHFCGVLGEVLRCGVENPVPVGHFALALAELLVQVDQSAFVLLRYLCRTAYVKSDAPIHVDAGNGIGQGEELGSGEDCVAGGVSANASRHW